MRLIGKQRSVLRLSENLEGRDFVCGDIHGGLSILNSALKRVAFDYSKDRLICTGDLIDRGPNSLECLMLLKESWFYSCIGNHEVMLEDRIENRDIEYARGHIINGGDWYNYDYGSNEQKECLKLIKSMPIAIELEVGSKTIGVCHAEPTFYWKDISDPYNEAKVVWGRSRVRSEDNSFVQGIDHIYCGHTILSAPKTLGNVTFIDTGAWYSGNLHLVNITEKHND